MSRGWAVSCDVGGHPLCGETCPLVASLKDGKAHEVEVFLLHKQGRRVPVTARIQPLRGADGAIVGAVQIFSDDSAEQDTRRRKSKELGRLAFLDQVTQLPNRRFVEMSLHTALTEYRVRREPFGVLVIDVDRFKAINDELGHATGDHALLEVAKTLFRERCGQRTSWEGGWRRVHRLARASREQ